MPSHGLSNGEGKRLEEVSGYGAVLVKEVVLFLISSRDLPHEKS